MGVVPAIILVAQVTLMTPDGYKSVPQLEAKYERAEDATRDVHDSDDELSDNEVRKLRAQRREHRESKLAELDKLLGDADFREAREHKEEERHAASGVWGALHGKSAGEQMLSPWFILMTLLTVLQMLRMNFFIATIRTQYEVMLGSEKLSKNINSFFDIALPVGGVAATPFIGMLLGRVRQRHLLRSPPTALLFRHVRLCNEGVWFRDVRKDLRYDHLLERPGQPVPARDRCAEL